MSIQRIVSLAPSHTEILFALGEGGRLVGVTEFCNYPPEARLIEKIGGFSTPDIEKIISLAPDLVLAMDFHVQAVGPQIKSKDIAIYALEVQTILDAPRVIASVGRLIDCEEKAIQVSKAVQQKIEGIAQRTKTLAPKTRICYICASDPLCIAQRTCAISTLLDLAGGVNIMQDVAIENVQNLFDVVVEKDPQVIITSKGHRETTDLFAYVMDAPRLKETEAYRNNRIYQIDAELVCRPGPRAALGLETLARYIHPEVFQQG